MKGALSMRRMIQSHESERRGRGGTSPTVLVAASAGLLLIALGAWLVWPRGETPSEPRPPIGPTTTIDEPKADAQEPDPDGVAATWPPSESGDEPDETKIRKPRGSGGGIEDEPIDDEPDGPREPASAHRPPDLEP
jgi:hypothetical protein